MKTLTTLSVSALLALNSAFVFAADRANNLFERYDTNGDKVITQNEVQAAKTIFFTEADSNQDGFLTAAELQAGLQKQQQQLQNTVFASFDTNKDGMVSLAELEASATGKRAAHLSKIFKLVDSNSDNNVTQEEWTAFKAKVQEKHGDKKEERQEKMFNKMDLDKDGKLSKDEFVKQLPLFDRLDSNEDGVITQDEILQQLQKREKKLRE